MDAQPPQPPPPESALSALPHVSGPPSSGASESGKSDTSSARRRWKAVIAALPPVLPSQQQMMQQLLQDSGYTSSRVIDPDWIVNRAWNVLVVCVLLFNAASVPFRVAFLPPQSLDGLWTVGLACDGLLALDAVLTLNRGFHDQGHKEMDRAVIRRRFACRLLSSSHSTLAIYLLALAPIDLLELSGRRLYARGALRANRLLLTPHIFTLLRELLEVRLGRHAILLARLVLLFLLLVHFIGCSWYTRTRRPMPNGPPRPEPHALLLFTRARAALRLVCSSARPLVSCVRVRVRVRVCVRVCVRLCASV